MIVYCKNSRDRSSRSCPSPGLGWASPSKRLFLSVLESFPLQQIWVRNDLGADNEILQQNWWRRKMLPESPQIASRSTTPFGARRLLFRSRTSVNRYVPNRWYSWDTSQGLYPFIHETPQPRQYKIKPPSSSPFQGKSPNPSPFSPLYIPETISSCVLTLPARAVVLPISTSLPLSHLSKPKPLSTLSHPLP